VKAAKTLMVVLLLVAVAAMAFGLAACGSDNTTATAASTATTGSATTATSAGTDTTAGTAPASSDTTAAAGPAQTIKIGLIVNKAWPLGVNFLKNIQVWQTMVNDAGGFDVGGTKYKIDTVSYDSNGDQATAVSYMNRLIFEDKVKYVFSDPSVVDPLVPIAEKNHVIYACSFPTETLTATTNNYAFYTDANVTQSGLIPNWLKTDYAGKTKIVVIYPDSQLGHIAAETGGGTIFLKALGFQLTQIFVPPSQTDLSSIGTKIANDKPDFVMCQATGDAIQGSVFNAAYASGYRGMFVNGGTQSVNDAKAFINPDPLNNMVQFADGLAFDTPANPTGEKFKAEWIKENGNFDTGSMCIGEPFTPWLIAAMQKAGSVDPEKLGPVVKNGLQWECGYGTMQMIAPKKGDPTTQCMGSSASLKVVDGKGVKVKDLSLDQMIEWYYQNVDMLAASQAK
jgi:branched-chain amino acid transport system substrate-binding protein